ncbi:MAG: polysaccharide biosynthesis/export family protein, partial [Bacteroidales bacterium]
EIFIMRVNHYLFKICLLLWLTASCTAHKQIGYLKDIETLTTEQMDASAKPAEVRFMPGDMMTIVVNTTDPNASKVFNLIVPRKNSGNDVTLVTGQEALQTYLVSKEGSIDFPVLGRIEVAGKTKAEVEELIKSKIYPEYITEEPIITIRLINFKVSVMGEVTNPGVLTFENEQANLLEALTMAGDLTIFGRRDNVLVIRQDAAGKKTIYRLNLQDKEILLSDAFQLQQNDVIYVEPNKSKGNTSRITSNETIWFSVLGSLMSIATLIITILR